MLATAVLFLGGGGELVSRAGLVADDQFSWVFGAAVLDAVGNFRNFAAGLGSGLLGHLREVTLAARGHVRFSAADVLDVVARDCAQRVRRLVLAQLADCVQLLQLLRLRDQVKDGVEGLAETVAAQSADNYNFACVGRRLAEPNDLNATPD